MTTSDDLIEEILDNVTRNNDISLEITNNASPKSPSVTLVLSIWFLRLTCVCIIFICPWANYKLIEFFQIHRFHKESSARWYIIFKAVFDTLYVFVSIPTIFFFTFHIDIFHKHILTCKFLTYIHYLSDDLISIILALLCIDRMIRITCSYRLRQGFSLTICIITVFVFMIINIHHMIRLKYEDGFCQKVYTDILSFEFDIYYSYIYTSITWAIIFIASINLTISVYCDRTRRIQIKKQQQEQEQQEKISKILLNRNEPFGADSDRVELINNTDDMVDDLTTITIEQNASARYSWEQEQQDNIDLQLTVCVLITSAIFLACNIPHFIMFVMRFVHNATFSTVGNVFIYISLFPLLISHAITYFIFNHLAARIFPNSL